jgi:hypothetical protein
MYAYYKGDIDKLTQDDLWAIQYLYGRPERLKYELIPTTTTVKPTASKVWQRVPEGDYGSAGPEAKPKPKVQLVIYVILIKKLIHF